VCAALPPAHLPLCGALRRAQDATWPGGRAMGGAAIRVAGRFRRRGVGMVITS
jgi:hypothetical protein